MNTPFVDLLSPSELASLHPLAQAFAQGDPARELLVQSCAQGFSEAVVREGLRAELLSWHPEDLAQLKAALPEDALSPRSILILSARTLPASTLRQVLFSLELGAKALIKPASDQEALAYAIASAHPDIEVANFRSSDTEAAKAAIAQADTVCVLGSDETVSQVARLLEARQGYAPHGHKFSGVYLNAPLSDAEALALASDVLAWDQSGCLAPRFVWVDGPQDLREAIGQSLHHALQTLEACYPQTTSARAIHLSLARPMKTLTRMMGGLTWETQTTLLASHPHDAFKVSEGARTLWLLPFSLEALAAHLPYLTGLATASALAFELAPHTRVCALGELQRPPLTWLQDGLHPLLSLLPAP